MSDIATITAKFTAVCIHDQSSFKGRSSRLNGVGFGIVD